METDSKDLLQKNEAYEELVRRLLGHAHNGFTQEVGTL